VTKADQEHAVYKASQGASRTGWEFVATERHDGTRCPFDTRDPDPKSIAAESGYHWAYAVYPAGHAR
jgi:hypothetical protein